MSANHSHIIKMNKNSWYLESRTGFEGPFSSEKEASTFLNLLKASDAARMEFAGLEFTPITE